MIRPLTLIWLVLASVLGFALFQVKHKVQMLEEELAQLNRTILDEQEAIHVLKAEWSYLNQPERLQALNVKYLGLAPVSAAQVAAIEDLPMRIRSPSMEGGEADASVAADGHTGIEAAPAAPSLRVRQARLSDPRGRQ